MKNALAIVAVVALSLGLSGEAFAKAAQCRDAKGKFIKCAAPAAAAAAPAGYKLDAKGNCHDAKGKMAKKAMCSAKG